jgi:hypothetical protein
MIDERMVDRSTDRYIWNVYNEKNRPDSTANPSERADSKETAENYG